MRLGRQLALLRLVLQMHSSPSVQIQICQRVLLNFDPATGELGFVDRLLFSAVNFRQKHVGILPCKYFSVIRLT